MRPKFLVLGAAIAAASIARPTFATELIVNGGFETGDLTGWAATVQPGSSGNLFVSSGTLSPLSSHPTPGPAKGSFYAVSDQPGPGSYPLMRGFTIDAGVTGETVGFNFFANSSGSPSFPSTSPTRDYLVAPNENVVVDILHAGSNPFTVNPAV